MSRNAPKPVKKSTKPDPKAKGEEQKAKSSDPTAEVDIPKASDVHYIEKGTPGDNLLAKEISELPEDERAKRYQYDPNTDTFTYTSRAGTKFTGKGDHSVWADADDESKYAPENEKAQDSDSDSDKSHGEDISKKGLKGKMKYYFNPFGEHHAFDAEGNEWDEPGAFDQALNKWKEQRELGRQIDNDLYGDEGSMMRKEFDRATKENTLGMYQGFLAQMNPIYNPQLYTNANTTRAREQEYYNNYLNLGKQEEQDFVRNFDETNKQLTADQNSIFAATGPGSDILKQIYTDTVGAKRDLLTEMSTKTGHWGPGDRKKFAEAAREVAKLTTQLGNFESQQEAMLKKIANDDNLSASTRDFLKQRIGNNTLNLLNDPSLRHVGPDGKVEWDLDRIGSILMQDETGYKHLMDWRTFDDSLTKGVHAEDQGLSAGVHGKDYGITAERIYQMMEEKLNLAYTDPLQKQVLLHEGLEKIVSEQGKDSTYAQELLAAINNGNLNPIQEKDAMSLIHDHVALPMIKGLIEQKEKSLTAPDNSVKVSTSSHFYYPNPDKATKHSMNVSELFENKRASMKKAGLGDMVPGKVYKMGTENKVASEEYFQTSSPDVLHVKNDDGTKSRDVKVLHVSDFGGVLAVAGYIPSKGRAMPWKTENKLSALLSKNLYRDSNNYINQNLQVYGSTDGKGTDIAFLRGGMYIDSAGVANIIGGMLDDMFIHRKDQWKDIVKGHDRAWWQQTILENFFVQEQYGGRSLRPTGGIKEGATYQMTFDAPGKQCTLSQMQAMRDLYNDKPNTKKKTDKSGVIPNSQDSLYNRVLKFFKQK